MKSIEAIARRLRPEDFDVVIDSNAVKLPPVGRTPVFYHSGDYGDIIYALPTIRALGGGKLVLGPHPLWRTRQRLTEANVNALHPLLELQPYITSVAYAPAPPPDIDFDLNRFREYLISEPEQLRQGNRRLNLAEAHLYTFKLPLSECERAWLTIDYADPMAWPVLFHRSARWRNEEFPWSEIIRRHGKQAAFVGLDSEFKDFTEEQQWSDLPHLPTADFLQLARLIAGCKLYIGNQSLPYAICEGLKHFSVLEVWPEGPNCLFKRENAIYGYSRDVYIPKLESRPMNKTITNCPLCGEADANAKTLRAGTDIVACPACSVAYLRTRPDAEETLLYYQHYADDHSHMRLPKNFEEVSSSGLRRDYFMRELMEFTKPPGDLLDIGCGWGAFLLNARDKGFTPHGIDVCHKAADFGSKTLGIPISCDELTDGSATFPSRGNDQYSAITAIHTLEHLNETNVALVAIHWLLGRGGVFAGIVPNFASLCSEKRQEKWQWLDSHTHYVHFTPETLRSALESHGFDVLRIYTHTGDYDQAEVQSLLSEQHGKPLSGDELTTALQTLWDGGKGEEIRFFARKRP